MQVAGFERWLKDTMGLDVTTIGPLVVQRAVRERMQACECSDLAAYWEVLRNRTVEQQELIEAVVVPETWFFRDREAFAALARTFDPSWLATRPDGAALRLLSLPCSTGEEPYTMIMALRDAGYPIERLQVDAFDISERALAKARRGVYGTNSFRGQDLQFRERHFRAAAGGWELSTELRARANFRSGNMLEPGFLPGESLYDAIFCRNLLIYFDQETQVRAVGVLSRLLRAEGLLFVGPSETGLMLTLGFASVQIPMAFAFRKGEAAGAARAKAEVVPAHAGVFSRAAVGEARAKSLDPRLRGDDEQRQKQQRRQQQPQLQHLALQKSQLQPSQLQQPPLQQPHLQQKQQPQPQLHHAPGSHQGTDPSLESALALADSGKFEEAAKVCEAYVRRFGPTAQAHYLLGLIDGAGGRTTRAEAHYRKAIYLQPDHPEALVHLAILLEGRGDAAGGRLLRQRAQRHHRREAT